MLNPSPVPFVELVSRPSLFTAEKTLEKVPHGLTVLEILEAAGVPPVPGCEVCVYVDGSKIPIPEWHVHIPEANTQLTAVAVPLDGGLGGGNTTRIIATIAVITAAIAIGNVAGAAFGTGLAGTIAGSATTAAISAGGIYAVNSLMPADLSDPEGDNFDIGSTVSGQSNAVKRFAPIPFIAGGPIRVYPNHAALPYTEPAGDDIYLRLLLCPGLGPLEITDIRLGETPVASLGTDEVEVEVFEGRPTDPDPTLFSQDVNELEVNTEIRRGDGPIIRTTALNTSEISFDVFFPNGIVDQNSNGKQYNAIIQFDIDYRITSPQGPWLPILDGDFSMSGKSRKPLRRSIRFRGLDQKPNQYDIRITRRTGDSNLGTNLQALSFWTVLRSIAPGKPVNRDDVALIALLVKRDGPVEAVNCLVRSYAPTWNGAVWVEAPTNNPASLYRLTLQGPSNPEPLPDSALRLSEDLEAWYDTNAADGLECNIVFEDLGTVQQRQATIAAAGKAQISRPDGRFGVVIDEEKITPIALITPRNSWGYRYIKPFTAPPEALRCQFYNEDEDFAEDERLVFADGINQGNVDGSKIEVLNLRKQGITNPDQVWRTGRRRIAELQLRPERYQVNQDVEQLVLTLGDLCLLQNDVMLVGLGPGRVKTITTDGGGNATAITTDELFTMEVATNYGFTFRSIDTTNNDIIVTRQIVTVPGVTNSFTFTTPVPPADIPSERDVVAFGVLGQETIETVVRDLFPLPNNQARLTLVPHGQPGINDAETGAIPTFNSNITLPGDFFGTPPDVPIISGINTEQIAFPGQPTIIAQVQIIIRIDPRSALRQAPESYQVRIREEGENTWAQQASFPGDTRTLELSPRTTDSTYQVQVRALGRSPRGVPNQSQWSSISSVFVPEPETTISDVGRVVGLELIGQANDIIFSGTSPTFGWRFSSGPGDLHLGITGGKVGFPDPAFAFFEVVIRNTDGTIRRTEQVTTPQYTYDFSRNFDDGRRLGEEAAARNFTAEVAIVDAFGQQGQTNRLTVNNPSPIAPTVSVTPGVSSILVNGGTSADPDFAGIIVWASESSGFSPGPGNEVARARQTSVVIAATPGQTLYLRVAFFDDFGSVLEELNLSSEFVTTAIDTSAVPEFTFTDITFEPNSPGTDDISWTAGTANIFSDGASSSEAIAAGQATYPGAGVLFLYYTRGLGIVTATTDFAQAAGVNNAVLATYRGGADLSQGLGKVFQDGSLLIAGTIIGQAIAAGTITGDLLAAESLIVESAQIGTAVVDTLQVKNGAINAIETEFIPSTASGTTEGAWFDLIEGTLSTSGFNLSIRCSFSYVAKSTSTGANDPFIECQVRLLIDGVQEQVWPFGSVRRGGVQQSGVVIETGGIATPNYIAENQSAGPHTYKFEVRIFDAQGNPELDVSVRTLELQETKR